MEGRVRCDYTRGPTNIRTYRNTSGGGVQRPEICEKTKCTKQ